MAPDLPGLAGFIQQLKADRLIKIFIGEQSEPYLVQESILVNASDVLAVHIKHTDGHLFSGYEPGVLRFPEGEADRAAWEILLYWLLNKQLPGEDDDDGYSGLRWQCTYEDLIRTWFLADQYCLEALQDSIMAELLHWSYHSEQLLTTPHQLSEMLLRSGYKSPMRRLLEEETIRYYCRDRAPDLPPLVNYLSHDMKLSSSLFMSLTGASEAHDLRMSIVHALHKVSGPDLGTFLRHDHDNKKRLKSWKEYFVLKSWPDKEYISDSLRLTDWSLYKEYMGLW